MLAGPGGVLSYRTPTTVCHSRVCRAPFPPPRLPPGMRPLSLQREVSNVSWAVRPYLIHPFGNVNLHG
eukprot:1019074-Rhodomonas_salina.1